MPSHQIWVPETLNVMISILQKAENSCDAPQLQIIMVSKEMFFSLSTTASDDPLMLGSSLHRKLFLLGSKWGTQHHVFMVLWFGDLSRGTMLTQGKKLNKERPSRMCLQTLIHHRAEKVVKKIEDPTAPAMRAPMYQVLYNTPIS